MKKLLFAIGYFLLEICQVSAQEGARYLVITHDNFYNAIQPLVQWKHKKGMKTKVVKLSEIGSSNTQIRNYIVNAYNTWNPRPEFILLVGSTNLLPSWYRSSPPYNYNTDNEYANMTGDYRAEIPYGRFICKTVTQCSIMVRKTLLYERNPDTSDSLWFRKLTTIANVDGDPPDDSIYFRDIRYVATLALNNGYLRVDTFSDYFGQGASNVINAVNNGRAFVVYRGVGVGNWNTPFNVNPASTNNGNKLPIICSFTCATASLTPGESMVGEAWVKAGTVAAPKGAVAFVGNAHTDVDVAPIRSAMTRGFFDGVFVESLENLGYAVLRGKERIYTQFARQNEYEGFNLLGDPELNTLTGTPIPLTVSHPSNIRVGPQILSVSVLRRGIPVSRALVCVTMDSTVYAYGYTDNSGTVSLNINPPHPGNMDITVTARNSYPYESQIVVIPPTGAYLIYFGQTIDDMPPRGNGDGQVNPGEIILANIGLKNIGDASAYHVIGILRSNDSLLTITDSIKNYGEILPDSVVFSQEPFSWTVSPSSPNGEELDFRFLTRSSSPEDSWLSPFNITVKAGKLTYERSTVSDPAPGGNNNGRFDPGESGKLLVTLKNTGLASFQIVRALLRTNDLLLTITDSTGSYGSIPAGEERTNAQDYFALSISPNAYSGYRAKLRVIKIGQGGTYTLIDSSEIVLTIGSGQADSPTGPDAYGYYAYDNTDISSGRAPTYNWFEIQSIGQLISEITNSNDAITTKPLPFRFQYYGVGYDSVSVSSNGFLTMGRSTTPAASNTQIPSIGEPRAVIGPFWDDLNLGGQMGYGEVYQYFDANNHRYIVEFKEAAHNGARQTRETFQVILYDPVYYSTPTGDGEILFQYSVVSNSSSNTVGIEDHTETRGIQYLYDNSYDPTAANLQGGRAIKFTTNPPVSSQTPWLIINNYTVNDSLGGNGNGVPEPGETFDLTSEIFNRGTALAQSVSGKIRSIDNDVLVLDSTKTFGDIPAGGIGNNSSNPFGLRVSSAPEDSIAEFLLLLTGNSGSYNTVVYFTLSLGSVVGVEENENSEFGIWNSELKIYPNPFRSSTVIRQPSAVNRQPFSAILIYDINGRLVKSFSAVDGKRITEHGIIWDGKDERGIPVNSGVYFVTLNTVTSNEQRITMHTLKVIRLGKNRGE